MNSPRVVDYLTRKPKRPAQTLRRECRSACWRVWQQILRNGRSVVRQRKAAFGNLRARVKDEASYFTVEKCLECNRYEREIQNLQQGLRIAKDQARGAGDKVPREQFGLMLNLASRLDQARKNYSRHRTAHASLN
jgi:hypothetical protein